jgi:phosphoribosylanthranilate isomerase
MQIKVCGITNNRNLQEIARLGPDFMGFIFHGPSPRDVTSTIDQLHLNLIPSSVKKVAVTVDEPLEYVLEILKKYRFGAIQLHGNEEPEYCRRLMASYTVIKAFAMADSLPQRLQEYEGSCDYFLFDAKGRHAGGNGIKFNHEILGDYRLSTPWILSGGIGDSDLPLLTGYRFKGMAGVDLNSRFELSPGYKSITSLREFINKLRTNAAVTRQ